jgi:hypothetical protein
MSKTAQTISKAKASAQQDSAAGSPVKFIFGKTNYLWFVISIAVVTLGFFLMAGTTDIYSSTKIVVAPVVVLAGFGIGFYAILKKSDA